MKRLLACLAALALTLLPLRGHGGGIRPLRLGTRLYHRPCRTQSGSASMGQTYAQHQATHGETFDEMTIRDADTAQSYADKGMECFFAPDDAGLSIVVQHSNLTMDDETLRQTLDGLRALYEDVNGGGGVFRGGRDHRRRARFEGIVYTIEGVTKAQLYQRGADGYNILTYTGYDWESVRSMLEASTLA